jgi:general secretion pathway protein G
MACFLRIVSFMDDNKSWLKRNWLPVTTLVAVLVVVATIVPEFLTYRTTTAMNPCMNTLRQIDGAKHNWAQDNGKSEKEIPTWNDIKPYLGRSAEGSLDLHCPEDTTRSISNSYVLGNMKTPPYCKINSHHRLQ